MTSEAQNPEAQQPATQKLRVLVIAEAANPEWTSVPLLGWSHTYALSRVCDVHLATQIRNKEAIERFGWEDGDQFTAINSEKLAAPFNNLALKIRGGDNLGWTIATAAGSLTYPYFEYLVWKNFKQTLKAGDFDVVHRITPVSPTAPSYLAKKLKGIGIPFVVGPLNGGVAWPKEFRDLQHQEKEFLSHIRNVYKLLPGYHALRKNASCIVAGSMATKAQLPDKYRDKILYLPENAIDTKRFSLRNTSEYSLPIKAAFVGRLVPYKGVDMAIEAMADLVRAGKMTFDIYGTGPEQEKLSNMVKDLGLEGKVTVHGFVPNTELQGRLVNADIFVFPSVREFGGGVVLESMALGVVPVIADYAGPAELVTKSSGYFVPLGPREVLIEGFKKQLTAICDDPEELVTKREAAIERIHMHYTWEKKAEQMLHVYRWLLGLESKPDYQQPFA